MCLTIYSSLYNVNNDTVDMCMLCKLLRYVITRKYRSNFHYALRPILSHSSIPTHGGQYNERFFNVTFQTDSVT